MSILNVQKNDKKKYLKPMVFEYLVRPQYSITCSITSLTSAFSCFKNDFLMQEDVAKVLGIDIHNDELNPGNTTMEKWALQLAKYYEVELDVSILYNNRQGWNTRSEGEKTWKDFTSEFKEPDTYYIMHIEGHYLPIMGYQSESSNPAQYESDDIAWLILADPSQNHSQSKIKKQHLNLSPPIWCMRWGVIGERFAKKAHYGIIKLKRK